MDLEDIYLQGKFCSVGIKHWLSVELQKIDTLIAILEYMLIQI